MTWCPEYTGCACLVCLHAAVVLKITFAHRPLTDGRESLYVVVQVPETHRGGQARSLGVSRP